MLRAKLGRESLGSLHVPRHDAPLFPQPKETQKRRFPEVKQEIISRQDLKCAPFQDGDTRKPE
jgi:hypothetical protein